MSFFKRLFNNDSSIPEKDFDWYLLNEVDQLEDLITLSYEKVVVIFKHSTRCSISRMALNRFEADFNFDKSKIFPVYLDLLSYRSISNEIASKFDIEHQSPQMIILKNGKVLFAASHENIDAQLLARYV